VSGWRGVVGAGASLRDADDGRRCHVREEGSMTRRLSTRFLSPDTGAATAEYAVVSVAAAGLGGILIKLLTSDWFLEIIKAILNLIITTVMKFFGLG
jgi:hypothetical protein